MHWFDHWIIVFVNQFAQRWPTFDDIVVFFTNSDLMKGGVMFAAVWWAWFRPSADQKTNRAHLLSALLGAVCALVLARILAHVLPMRSRPILDPSLHFQVPHGAPDQSNWTIWSSFPSDHASLFFALLTGVFLAWRRGGWIFLAYVIVGICLPRIYIGIHYPTDILAGAVIGASCVLLCSFPKFRRIWTTPILKWLERWPGPGYALLFIISFEIATLFWDVRTFLYAIFDVSL